MKRKLKNKLKKINSIKKKKLNPKYSNSIIATTFKLENKIPIFIYSVKKKNLSSLKIKISIPSLKKREGKHTKNISVL